MTIWIATLPVSSSEDTFDSPVGATPYTPPRGFKLLKRAKGISLNDTQDGDIELNLYKLGFPNPEDDIFWTGYSGIDEPGMTDERQTLINRTLCELLVKMESDIRTNLIAMWYLPKSRSPDEGTGRVRCMPIIDLRLINHIRARWLTREGAAHGS